MLAQSIIVTCASRADRCIEGRWNSEGSRCLLTVVSFIVVMSVIVFVHELGHLLAAKRNKIVVEEFGFGFPPRVVKLFERDGTVYSHQCDPVRRVLPDARRG